VSFSVTNIFDENPPFARTDINYDALTADPLGRTFKIGITKTF
jgi:iron complex outermembrane receptor protein